MSDPKPFAVLWSKAAVDAAGPDLSALQTKLIAEASKIVLEAHDWFLHALPGAAGAACFVCVGQELPNTWNIFVRTGYYAPMGPISGDHPDPERRGKILKFPETINDRRNETFLAYEDVAGH